MGIGERILDMVVAMVISRFFGRFFTTRQECKMNTPELKLQEERNPRQSRKRNVTQRKRRGKILSVSIILTSPMPLFTQQLAVS